MEEQAVIDRIVDGRHAVLLVGDDEREMILPVSRLPKNAPEGTWLRVQIDGDEITDMAVDLEETEAARQRIGNKMDLLRRREGRLPQTGKG